MSLGKVIEPHSLADGELPPPQAPQRVVDEGQIVFTYCTRNGCRGRTTPAKFNTRRLPKCYCGGILVQVFPESPQCSHVPQIHVEKNNEPVPLPPTFETDQEYETWCETCRCQRKMTGRALTARRPARCNCGTVVEVLTPDQNPEQDSDE